MKFDKEKLLKLANNPRIMVPAITAVVIITVLLVILGASSNPGGKTPAAAQAKQQAAPSQTTPLGKEEQEQMDKQYQYKFNMAQRDFNNGNYQRALQRLQEAEKFKKTPQSKKLADQLAQKMAEKKDHEAFKKAADANSIADLEEYLAQFPSGLHIEEAGEKIALVKEEEKKQEAIRQKMLAAALKLRSQYRNLEVVEVKTMMQKYNFFDKYYNSTGNFKNHYELKTVENDPVVHDYSTALIWHQSGSSSYMPLARAKEWLAALNRQGYAGCTDWRLPTLEEAASLLENTQNSRDIFVDEIFDADQKYIWTGDTFKDSKGWAVDFSNGDVNRANFSGVVYIRPVRSMR